MTFGSLFAGIGGIDLGLERAGMECKWQVEIDPFCQKVLEKHWPGVKRYGDITKLTGEELERVDLICGGFPCQPVSLAGKKRGDADPRWLWGDFRRIISILRPRFALLENVPGIFTTSFGCDTAFERVVGDLAEMRYDAEWSCIPAALFGAPHARERLFLVAYPDSFGREVGICPDSGYGGTLPFASSKRAGGNSRPDLAEAWSNAERLPNGKLYQPGIPLLVDGIPDLVDRLRCPGNAVVPQVAEWIGRRIQEAANV